MKATATAAAGVVLCMMALAPVEGRQADTAGTLTPQDLAEIQELSNKYARFLGTCAAEDYAALFTPDGSYSSSEFRQPKHVELFGTKGGRALGRDRIVELVMTEPYCMDPKGDRKARNGPTVTIVASPEGARGTAMSGAGGRYEDVYVKTPAGWRFKSRSNIRAGQTSYESRSMKLTPKDEADIRQLSVSYGRALGLCQADDYAAVFTPDGFYSSSEFMGGVHREMYGPSGGKITRDEMKRFVMSEPQCTDATAKKSPRAAPASIPVNPAPDGATAIIPLTSGGRYEDVYVKTANGWRIQSREHVRPGQQAFSKRTK